MNNTIAIRREGTFKVGEKRVAVIPLHAKILVDSGHRFIVQPRISPKSGKVRRAFTDEEYASVGVEVNEDISQADIIFGLKEIGAHKIMQGKTYLFFSHTHKGQVKNRGLLHSLVNNKATLIDFELIRDENNHRLINAFTYNAGYAGMVDSLWTLGKRLKLNGINNIFEKIPQSIEKEDLALIKTIIAEAGKVISKEGTPSELPPIITCFLGKGKTSKGAQDIYDILPVKEITLNKLQEVFETGSRKFVYKLVLRKSTMYRLKNGSSIDKAWYNNLGCRDKDHHYMDNPHLYESNLDKIIPYSSLLMNCISWSHGFPRLLDKALMKKMYNTHNTLKVIGDITCDPEGAIEFSKETWIANPVFIYNPITKEQVDGFEGEGVAVMAITNLPCEFSADASRQFSFDLFPYLKAIAKANYKTSIDGSHLPDEIKRGVILWRGEFTPEFTYMKEYL